MRLRPDIVAAQPPAVVLLREDDAPLNADQVLGLQPTQSPRELLNDVSLSTDGTPIDSPLLLSVSTTDLCVLA